MEQMDINFARYGAVYGIATLVLSALPGMLGVQAAAGVTAALPPLVGAVIEGQAHAKAQGARASGSTAWRGAMVMTAIALAANLVLFGLAYTVGRDTIFGVGFPWGQLAGFALVLTLIQFGINRLGLRLAPQG